MADYTTKLHLKKPARTESYTVLDANGNADIIDEFAADADTAINDLETNKATKEEVALKTDIVDFKQETSKNDKRFNLLAEAAKGKLFTVDVDDDEAYTKDVPAGAWPSAMLNKFGGRTIAFNQIIPLDAFPTQTANGITLTNNGDGTYTLNGTATATTTFNKWSVPFVSGHKYYLCGCPSGGSTSTYLLDSNAVGYDTGNGKIGTNTSGGKISIIVYEGTTCNNLVFKPQVFNLTQMGLDSITTVNEVKAILPLDYYEYNAGELKSAKATNIKSVGVNVLKGIDFANELHRVSNVSVIDTTNKTVTFSRNAKGDDNVLFSYNFKENTRYTIYLPYANDGGNNSCIVAFYTDGTYDSIALSNSSGVKTSRTFYTKANATFVGLRLSWTATQLTTLWYDECGIMEGVLEETDFKPYFTSMFPIPAEVQALAGYGESHEYVYNYVDIENKKYYKFGYYDSEGTWVEDEEIIDITDLINDNMLAVEADGTITFENDLEGINLPVPNEEAFYIKIADAI